MVVLWYVKQSVNFQHQQLQLASTLVQAAVNCGYTPDKTFTALA
jgi:hypothetical protein